MGIGITLSLDFLYMLIDLIEQSTTSVSLKWRMMYIDVTVVPNHIEWTACTGYDLHGLNAT